MQIVKAILTALWCALLIGLNAPALLGGAGWMFGGVETGLDLSNGLKQVIAMDVLLGAALALAGLAGLIYVRSLWAVVWIAIFKAGIVLWAVAVVGQTPGALGLGFLAALVWAATAAVSFAVIRWNYSTQAVKADAAEEF